MSRMIGVLLIFALLCSYCPQALTAAEVIDINTATLNDPRIVLEQLRKKVNAAFAGMEKDLSEAARAFSLAGLSSQETKDVLSKLYAGKDYLIDVAAIDLEGIMVTIEPESFSKHEGEDISAQPQFKRLLETKKPVLSDVFMSTEGVNAIDFEYPVFSEKGELIGAVSMLIKYEELFSPIIMPVVSSGPFDVWIIQKDGLTLYDPDKEEIGKNVFNDPLYKPFPSYVALCRRISQEETGFGTYNFLNKGLGKPVNKDAAWTTIGVHGAQWRMVVVQERRTI